MAASIPEALLRGVGAGAMTALTAVGRATIVWGRATSRLPTLSVHELLRSMVQFGTATLPLALVVAAVTGATAVLQTSLYVQRFGARGFLGWAAGYAILWEFGPLVLCLLAAARIGGRNAAELASLKVGGQLEGLAGVSLDPYRLLIAPRMVALVSSVLGLAVVTFTVAIVFEALAALLTLGIPLGAFFQSLAGMLSAKDLVAGLTKCLAFGTAIAVVSSTAGLSASGGARAVGQAAATAVVHSAGSIFLLDFALTPLLDRVLG